MREKRSGRREREFLLTQTFVFLRRHTEPEKDTDIGLEFSARRGPTHIDGRSGSASAHARRKKKEEARVDSAYPTRKNDRQASKQRLLGDVVIVTFRRYCVYRGNPSAATHVDRR